MNYCHNIFARYFLPGKYIYKVPSPIVVNEVTCYTKHTTYLGRIVHYRAVIVHCFQNMPSHHYLAQDCHMI